MQESSGIPHKYRVVIAGARHMFPQPDYRVVEALVLGRQTELKDLMVFSIGCDVGIGGMVKSCCLANKIPFAELSMHYSDQVTAAWREAGNLSRHSALISIGEEIHIFVSDNRMSDIEDLADLAQKSGIPTSIYGRYGKCIEKTDKETIPRSL